ncbi:MAG TPA: hypothetical protein VFN92_03305 [Solirubrobacterales bacterium]|nr:hypothetical protein [Solirubrobacterales bacterium]
MALPEALLFAARSWPHLREQIELEEVDAVRRLLAAAVHGADWDPEQLVRLLFGHEQEDFGGWHALAERPVRGHLTVEPPTLLAAAAELRFRLEEEALVPGLRELLEPAPVEEVERAAEEQLWLVPMRRLVGRQHGEEPVIALEREGEWLAPAFQFAADMEVDPGVAEVNALLDASEDPWGAASWWLTPHAALHAIPADALRIGLGEVVLAAARAAGELD